MLPEYCALCSLAAFNSCCFLFASALVVSSLAPGAVLDKIGTLERWVLQLAFDEGERESKGSPGKCRCCTFAAR